MIFGYARVSTAEQKLETQIELLKQQGCEKTYTDIASGVREDRKGLNEMLSFLREGDVVIVYKTDRIFRSLKNMIELIEFFNQKGVFFKSISEPAFDTTSANGKFIIQIFGAVAEFERNLIGRPKGIKKETLEKYHFAFHLYENKNIPIDKACKQVGISKTSFYRVEKTLKKEK